MLMGLFMSKCRFAKGWLQVFVGRAFRSDVVHHYPLQMSLREQMACRTIKARPTRDDRPSHHAYKPQLSVFVGRCLQVRRFAPLPFENVAARTDDMSDHKGLDLREMTVLLNMYSSLRGLYLWVQGLFLP